MSLLPSNLDSLRAAIRKAGLRSTAPRVAVLRRLMSVSSPVSHADLIDTLTPEGLDRTTIYRNLLDLTEAGLVQRTDVGDHVWRFELRKSPGDTTRHPHFTCTDCGTVSCLPEVSLQVKSPKAVPKSLAKQRVEIQLRGVCDGCA